ncbi:MAG: radical SAM protein [Elusimicrobia bacterium RIFOXYD2_FULL_34_15]|nr:MAG: radical SAM protein [Elusimicrobia bacterium RIFOXYD2_FULL_34_15]
MNTDKKKCVALVRGPIVFKNGSVNNEATPAIAYAYISSYLNKYGYKTVIVDAIKEGLNLTWPFKDRPGYSCQGLQFEKIIFEIPKDSDIIGFSAMFSGEWPVLRTLIAKVRKSFPKALFVAGGEHITALTEYSLRDCPELNVCVRGEGEHTFYKLLETYSKTGNFADIEGIGYLNKDNQYCQNGDRTPRIENLNDIPWPAWPEGYLETFWKEGKSYGIATKRDMPFIISRGCPYQCTFCSSPQMWTNRYVLRDMDDIIKEIKYYITRYNITSLQLYDLTAIVKKQWIIEFCQRLISEKINLFWSLPSGTRSEALDSETISLLKKTGCNYLAYAPESGSLRILELIKKKLHLNRLTESVLEARRQGLTVRINLIIGFPDETWDDIFKTLFYGLKMSIKGVDEVPVFIFSAYPGTEIFGKLMSDKKIILNDDYFFNLTSLNGSYLSTNLISYNSNISSKLIVLIRIVFTLLNYIIGYILYPKRVFRTIKNLFSQKNAATVFEHRLKDLFKRKNIND